MSKIYISPTVVNKYRDPYTLYIGRGSKWGNPYTFQSLETTKAQFQADSREHAIELFEAHARRHLWDSLAELSDHILGCYCKPKSCHGDVLVKLFHEKFGASQ